MLVVKHTHADSLLISEKEQKLKSQQLPVYMFLLLTISVRISFFKSVEIEKSMKYKLGLSIIESNKI